MKIGKELGEKIRKIRKQKKITQEQLADKIGVKRSVVSKYENGNVNITLEMIDKIALALDVDPMELAFGVTSNDFRESFVKQANQLLMELRKETMEKYDRLNAKGQEKANDCITDLTKIDEYTTPDEALQSDEGDV